MKALANRRRLEIIMALRERGELNVGEIADAIKLSFRATSQHLRLLEAADMVESRQEGVMVFYRPTGTHKTLLRHILGD